MAGALLALDLATRFGWAHGAPGQDACSMEHGSVQLPAREGEGAVFAAYDKWLREALDRWQPRLVVYEAPFLDQHKTSIQTATRLIGLGVITVKCCYEARVFRIEQANNATVKKFMTGGGHAAKLDIIAAVRRFGFNVSEDNEADAIAVWLYSEARHSPHTPRAAGPLYAHA